MSTNSNPDGADIGESVLSFTKWLAENLEWPELTGAPDRRIFVDQGFDAFREVELWRLLDEAAPGFAFPSQMSRDDVTVADIHYYFQNYRDRHQ